MKTLPERPSLDHVRQQAKDLLIRLRSSQPDATLARAQSELAQEYGFRSWSDLKAEVDRLRATPRVADGATAGQLAAAFDLVTVTGPMTAIERGWPIRPPAKGSNASSTPFPNCHGAVPWERAGELGPGSSTLSRTGSAGRVEPRRCGWQFLYIDVEVEE
jgi:hypothetical protein